MAPTVPPLPSQAVESLTAPVPRVRALDGADPGAASREEKLGFRYTLNVIPLDPSCVRGTHGRLPADPADGPVLIASDASARRDRLEAVEVKGLLLELMGVRQPAPAT